MMIGRHCHHPLRASPLLRTFSTSSLPSSYSHSDDHDPDEVVPSRPGRVPSQCITNLCNHYLDNSNSDHRHNRHPNLTDNDDDDQDAQRRNWWRLSAPPTNPLISAVVPTRQDQWLYSSSLIQLSSSSAFPLSPSSPSLPLQLLCSFICSHNAFVTAQNSRRYVHTAAADHSTHGSSKPPATTSSSSSSPPRLHDPHDPHQESTAELLSERFPYIDRHATDPVSRSGHGSPPFPLGTGWQWNSPTAAALSSANLSSTKRTHKKGGQSGGGGGGGQSDSSDSDTDSGLEFNEDELFTPPQRRTKTRYGVAKVLLTMAAGVATGLSLGHLLAEVLRHFGLAPANNDDDDDNGNDKKDKNQKDDDQKNQNDTGK